MIALLIFISILLYILFSLFVINRVQTKKGKLIATVIMILIPIWDTLLHEPIYSYLSNKVPEITRYKPYEKIQGFYIDFLPNNNIAYPMYSYKTLENNYSLYFDKKTFKAGGGYDKEYFKAYWLNDSNSPLCFQPKPSSVEEKYIKDMKNNWCIAVEQIQENEMVNYWKLEKNIVSHIPILYMNIYIVDFIVSDQLTNERMFKLRDVFVDEGWITGLNFISGEGIRSGTNYTRAQKHYNSKPIFYFTVEQIIKILDSNNSIH